ncbi:MAG: aminotransferase class I/II-fold pyridoxal phosphate-dependent enzyme [Candidatus Geothermincolia bacterium]
MPNPEQQPIGDATNPSRARTDEWVRLRRRVERLHTLKGTGADTAAIEESIERSFSRLEPYEKFWVFPGVEVTARLKGEFEKDEVDQLLADTRLVERNLSERGDKAGMFGTLDELALAGRQTLESDTPHYFTVLVAEAFLPEEAEALKHALCAIQADSKDFIYQLLFVDNFVDAIAAALLNHEVQACLISMDVPTGKVSDGSELGFLREVVSVDLERLGDLPPGLLLAQILHDVRPHIDFYLLTDESQSASSGDTHKLFDRVFYNMDVPSEIHMTLLDGVRRRFETPFFDALKANAATPTGNFHALPIARGNSIFNSKWIRDMAEFYGPAIFMAETSSTTGGLDSLLAPTGTIKEAQDKAAKTWGSQHTYFATNGTSTSNKIVVQALCKPGDIVLIDRNCHKSHHYGMVLGGAYPLYLDAYPLEPYSIYGAVPLRTIKERLLELKKLGRLDQVRMLLLTNCTFDGIVYNPRQVMEEVLAIKPDICFLWDEAWYAFANFVPHSRSRTAMYSAKVLTERYAGAGYREEYAAYRERMDALDPDDDATWLDNKLMPDPDRARVRVYATQSTHKSLSALRQGSMIHVHDQDFARQTAGAFDEAYLAHTSTSPNYQIIASLDLARRQVDFEGYGMVTDVYSVAEALIDQVEADELLSKYFRILTPGELIPEEFRPSGLTTYVGLESRDDFARLLAAWTYDEFVLDPTRMTLYLACTGFNGNEFKVDVLMNEYGIQVNKTSINSVLFIGTIGVTWSSVAYLIDVLKRIAESIEERGRGMSGAEEAAFQKKVSALTTELPHLPDFSSFHPVFRPHPDSREGDMRRAYYLEYEEVNREYLPLDEAAAVIREGRDLVSTSFVVPYPPGFPVLVPGQVVSLDIIDFMQKLDVSEIHGYRADLGLSVFTEEALKTLDAGSQPA